MEVTVTGISLSEQNYLTGGKHRDNRSIFFF